MLAQARQKANTRRNFNRATIAFLRSWQIGIIRLLMSQFQAAKAQITRARSLRTRPRLIMQTLNLPPELHAIFDQDIPRFSNDEYQRRYNALARVMESAGIDHLLVVTAHHAGNATRW